MNGSSLALRLAGNVHVIAACEAAGQCFNDVQAAVDSIERMINRPVPPRDLGPCPTLVAHHKACATRLSAPRKHTEICCPACKTLHRVEDLVEILRNELLYWPLSSVEILGSRTSDLPGALDYWNVSVPRSTFHYWRKQSLLQVRGYRDRATLAIYPVRENDNDEPLFWLADVLDRAGVQWKEKTG